MKHEWDSIGALLDKSESELKSDGEDKLLNVKTVGAKYFPGKCSWCHKKGHKAKDCMVKMDDDKGTVRTRKFKGWCFKCNKVGHRVTDCLERSETKEISLHVTHQQSNTDTNMFEDMEVDEWMESDVSESESETESSEEEETKKEKATFGMNGMERIV